MIGILLKFIKFTRTIERFFLYFNPRVKLIVKFNCWIFLTITRGSIRLNFNIPGISAQLVTTQKAAGYICLLLIFPTKHRQIEWISVEITRQINRKTLLFQQTIEIFNLKLVRNMWYFHLSDFQAKTFKIYESKMFHNSH